MKLLVDAHIFDDKHQGTRTYLKGLYSKLVPIAKEWQFFFAAQDVENLKREFGIHQNITYVQLKSKNKFYRLLVELPQIIKKNKIDYAHFQYICPPLKNCKLIVTTHDILFEQTEFKKFFPLKYRLVNGFLFKRSAKKADLLLTVSKYSRTKISELYNIRENTIFITPNAVNINPRKPSGINQIKEIGKYLLYVSRVEPRKNHLTLLKAFVELNLSDQGFKLILIGKKDILYSELERYIVKNQTIIKDSVVWLDSVSNSNLDAYYQNCDLFVFPSFAEGFGIPPLEAMSHNCKILCSKATAMADFDLPDAIIFDPSDLSELKEKIKTQLLSKYIPKEIYASTLAKFSWQKIAQDYFKFLEEHKKTWFSDEV